MPPSGDAWGAGEGDSGTRRTPGPGHDAALHAPESGRRELVPLSKTEGLADAPAGVETKGSEFSNLLMARDF
jgi:hypothetical protein